jgi:hypothetical protein
MASLVPPSQEQFDKISHVQAEREADSKRRSVEFKRHSHELRRRSHEHHRHSSERLTETRPTTADMQAKAATTIQRTYRGYRSRRELEGIGIDASTRWVSALQEARFRFLNTPRPRTATGPRESDIGEDTDIRPSSASNNWKKAAIIARRAGHDEIDSSASSSSSSSSSSSDSEHDAKRKEDARKRREAAIAKRKKKAKMMGLQYFLEMVDLKHRYGSNLRLYHEIWKNSATNENFFYWLDYGEGKDMELDACTREQLENERVRYLSWEERQDYLVEVDAEGRLCWAKNGARIDTTEKFRDSIHGIVPVEDTTPIYQNSTTIGIPSNSDSGSGRSSEDSSMASEREIAEAKKYATPGFDNAKGLKKISHLSTATILNKLMRKSVKKNTWIFVADTSFRLYVGIKNSGNFQHSSFLQGSRISAAGLIKIKNGRLRSLSPLSGHYRPPASNFRAFVKNMKEAGVDMRRVSISKSYAVLVGLEMYVKTRRKGKSLLERMSHRKEKLLSPEDARKREEAAKDTSQSAQREREVLEEQAKKEDEEREANKATVKLIQKLHIAPAEPSGQERLREVGKDGSNKPLRQ